MRYTCQARIPLGAKPFVRPGPFGFPESVVNHCNQSVGLVLLCDINGRDWHACTKAGHVGDVEAQIHDAELAERVRHEIEDELRPSGEPHTAGEWAAIRPEMTRYVR